MRQAKVRAAERGESLKAFLTRAVEAELGRRAQPSGGRPRLPLFGHTDGPRRHVSNVDVARALADDDAAAVGAGRVSRSRRPARRS